VSVGYFLGFKVRITVAFLHSFGNSPLLHIFWYISSNFNRSLVYIFFKIRSGCRPGLVMILYTHVVHFLVFLGKWSIVWVVVFHNDGEFYFFCYFFLLSEVAWIILSGAMFSKTGPQVHWLFRFLML
jgi:hypothetical protein